MILIYSDIHHGVKIGVSDEDGIDLRIKDSLSIERQITDLCQQEGISNVIFAGDRFLKRTPELWLLHHVDRILHERTEKGITTHILLGNHDVFQNRLYESNYTPLWSASPYVKIYDKPNIEKIEGLTFSFLPFGFRLEDAVDGDVLVFHYEIKDVSDDRNYIGRKSWFTLDDLRKRFKRFVAGHIHSAKDFGFGIMAGSPYQIDVLDSEKDRGCWIFDPDRLDFRFVKFDIPQLIVRNIDSLDKLEEDKELFANNYVKIYALKDIADDVRNFLKSIGCPAFFVTEIYEQGIFVPELAKSLYQSQNYEDLVVELVTSSTVNNRDKAIEIGLNLLREAGIL